jgi:hypothetical protein
MPQAEMTYVQDGNIFAMNFWLTTAGKGIK